MVSNLRPVIKTYEMRSRLIRGIAHFPVPTILLASHVVQWLELHVSWALTDAPKNDYGTLIFNLQQGASITRYVGQSNGLSIKKIHVD